MADRARVAYLQMSQQRGPAGAAYQATDILAVLQGIFQDSGSITVREMVESCLAINQAGWAIEPSNGGVAMRFIGVS